MQLSLCHHEVILTGGHYIGVHMARDMIAGQYKITLEVEISKIEKAYDLQYNDTRCIAEAIQWHLLFRR